MPAPKKTTENLDDSLRPISELVQPNAIKISHHTNTDHITSLSPPKVTPKLFPHGQDGPKRKITPILTAPAYTSPQRTRRCGKTDNAFVSEVRLKTPNKKAVEIFDSSKMRAPKLIRPSGLLGVKIQEVQDTVEDETSKVKNTAELKVETDAVKMTSDKQNAEKSTKSAKNKTNDSPISPKEDVKQTLKPNISQIQRPKSPVTEQNIHLPTVSPIAEIPKDSQKSLQQQLRMPEIAVLDNVSMSKEATDNQSPSQPILTTTETSGNRFQTIAISVAGPKVSKTPGKELEVSSEGHNLDPKASETSGKEDVGIEAPEVQSLVPKASKTPGELEVLPEVQSLDPRASKTPGKEDVGSKTPEGQSLVPKASKTSEKEDVGSEVSVINVTKAKGTATKDVGSSSQANLTLTQGIHKEQKSPEDTMERDQKPLDGQNSLNDKNESDRNHDPSETLKGNARDQKTEDSLVEEKLQTTQMSTLSKPKDVRRKTSLQIMSSATDKKRRDSVAYLPPRPPSSSTNQRRVSLVANPSIPKRRTSIQVQLSNTTEVSQFSHRLTNFLTEKGFDYKVEESMLKLEIPVFKISNGAQDSHLVTETSLKDAVRSSKSGVTIVNDPWSDAEFLPLLKMIETGDSIKRRPPLTELVPETQSNDIQKENCEEPQSIENVIKEMNDNPTDYQIQLNNCQIISKYFQEESIQVLINKKHIIQAVLTSMKNFQDRQSLQAVACMSLLNIASVSDSNCEMINECEGLSTLNTIFTCYNDNITVQKLILTTWAYMSATEGLCKDMVNQGIHTEIMETMSRRSDDSNIIKQSCFILANLVNTEETAKQIMLVGGVHTVINVIEKYHQDSAILENGCRALGSFAAFDETCLDVAQAGATKTVVSILHDTLENVSVQECSLWALACLTSIAETCEEVINMDADEAVLDSLEKYPLEDNIQEYGVRIISNLASIESTSSEINSRRVLDILIKMLANYSTDLSILEHIFVTIGQTLLTYEDQKYLLESGGIRQIIGIMEKFNERTTILEHGCRIIGNMAVFEKLRSEVEDYEVSKVVINAMMLLDQVPEIQLCGCMALMNLTANVHTNKLNIMKHGGVSAILSCLDNFTNDSEILLTALKTLTNIISLENVCQSVVEKNGVHLLLSLANTTHLESDIYSYISIVLSGLTSLKELEFDILENIDTTLIKILNQYPEHVDICLAFCQAMENILASELGRRMFIYEDRLSMILKYTTQFIYHSHIQQIACKIIAIIAMDRNNNHVITSDCIKCLLSISIIHEDNLELQILTCGAISCILESNSDMSKIVEEEKGMNQIMKSLNRHLTDSRLHVLALMILANLASSVKKEDSYEINNIVLKTMAQFTENAEIQSYACHVLCRLSFSYDPDQVIRVLNSIRDTLKRHSHEEEVVKTASEVLHKMSQDGHQEEVDKVLKSPSLPQLPDFFWKTVNSVSAS